jgi:hypothetical protein
MVSTYRTHLAGGSVADPDPGYGAFWPLDPGYGSGMGKNPDPESKMNIPDHISETIFGVKNTLIDADPEPGSFWHWIRDGKNPDPGSSINIPDPQHWT